MNGAKHRFSLILTCLLLTGLTAVYPFLLYTDNAFVTKWREWYIETAMGTMTHQWLATSFIPHDMIEKVMTKRYLMNQKQAGAEVLYVPAGWACGENKALHWRTLLCARAIENNIPVIGADQYIPEQFIGSSAIYAATGAELASLGAGEGLLITEI